jgi:wyosine [tRNA(Phe)-imidazoG37] synthetase (radical SAM superfamily)
MNTPPPTPAVVPLPGSTTRPERPTRATAETAFGCPRNFLQNRYVYTVISPRAAGLSIGVNLNPNRCCNFDCLYCEVDRGERPDDHLLDVSVMAEELGRTLESVHSGELQKTPAYRALPSELVQLRHVSLSGDGEPTQCECFVDAVQAVMHVRAQRKFPFFRVILISNATGLDRPEVQKGLKYFTASDELWLKLDAGTSEHLERINRPNCSLEHILQNVLATARIRPVVIQSLFATIDGAPPSTQEIEEYVRRVVALKEAGAQISLVQIYSATRPSPRSVCGHLPLRTLSHIAQRLRLCGLKAEVF